MNKFPKVGTFTDEELTEWLDTFPIPLSIATLEKLYKDLRDHALTMTDYFYSQKENS